MCVAVCACKSAHLHGNEMTNLASETDTFKAGTAGSLWSAAEVLILLFGPVGI